MQRGKDGKYRVVQSGKKYYENLAPKVTTQNDEYEEYYWQEEIGPGYYDIQSHEGPGKYLSSK